MQKFCDVVVLGAGASGLMCALEAAKRGRKVLLIDHTRQAGNKIRISGGGRCNFTNQSVQARNYLGQNAQFCQSALHRYTPHDFLMMVRAAGIPFEEREHGQLFCTVPASRIVEMLLAACLENGVELLLETTVEEFAFSGPQNFLAVTPQQEIHCQSFVVASGALSFPGLGATAIGHYIAEQAEIPVVSPRPGLVPLTWSASDATRFAALAGIALPAVVHIGKTHFRENILFTHRGLSGPAILQISSFWNAGQAIGLNLLPECDLQAYLKEARSLHKGKMLRSVIQELLPKRLISSLLPELPDIKMADCPDRWIVDCSRALQEWNVVPAGTEGYAKAEVTCGGVATSAISSKTMEAKNVPGLYFIGEVLDITGWLGGYNLQWAWSSGWCAGQYV